MRYSLKIIKSGLCYELEVCQDSGVGATSILEDRCRFIIDSIQRNELKSIGVEEERHYGI